MLNFAMLISKNLSLVSRFALILVPALILTGCGPTAINGSSKSTSSQSGTDTTSGTDTSGTTDTSAVWKVTEGDGGSHPVNHAVICNTPANRVAGVLETCTIYWTATNISNVPQTYSGYSFAVVDGKTYQSSDEYVDPYVFNPGSTNNSFGGNVFDLPYGGNLTAFFKAEDATSPHLLDLPLNYILNN